MDITTLLLSIIVAFMLFAVLVTRDATPHIGAIVCGFIVNIIRVIKPDYLKKKDKSDVIAIRRITLGVLITFYLVILISVHQILTLLNKI